MDEENVLLQSRRENRSLSRDNLSGFTWLVLILFTITGFVRLWQTGTPPEKIAEFNAIKQEQGRLMNQYSNRLETEKLLMADMGPAYGFTEAYKLRYDLYPMYDSLARIDAITGMVGLELFLNKAQANFETRFQAGLAEFNERAKAQQQYGFHPMEANSKVSLSGLMKIPKGLFNHVIFYMMFIPFLLIGRLMYKKNFSGRELAKAFGPYAWWLVFCTVLWPFCATMHAEREPKVTTRFFWLRFLYMFSHGKLFITVAEKEILLHSAGTADEAVDVIFAQVEHAAATATGAGRRLAIVSYVFALFTFSGIQVQPIMAQDTTVTKTQKNETPKPSFNFSGYSIMSLQATPTGQTFKFNYLRVKPVYVNGRWSLKTEFDINATTKAKVAYIGYDSPEIRMRVEFGRIIAPYAWNFIPPNKDEFNRTPLDDVLGAPFFDNGVVVSRDFTILGRNVATMLAVTNGGGGYEDDNSSMDVSARVSANTPVGTFNVTGQRGQQPAGMRGLYALGYELNSGPFAFRCLGVERPDIDGKGFMTSVVTRAGPWRFSIQYDQAAIIKTTTNCFYDLGVNLTCAKNTSMKFRSLLSDHCGPEFSYRIVQLF